MIVKKKAEVKETLDGVELVAKHRNDSGIIVSYLTKEKVEVSADDVSVNIENGLTFNAKGRDGKLVKCDYKGAEIITPDGHNLGHLPEF